MQCDSSSSYTALIRRSRCRQFSATFIVLHLETVANINAKFITRNAISSILKYLPATIPLQFSTVSKVLKGCIDVVIYITYLRSYIATVSLYPRTNFHLDMPRLNFNQSDDYNNMVHSLTRHSYKSQNFASLKHFYTFNANDANV